MAKKKGTVTNLVNATVFVDLDNDGTQDSNEISGVTDANGNFLLKGKAADLKGNLVAIHGTNSNTGEANTETFIAPVNAKVINPITSVIVEIAELQNISIKDAAKLLGKTFELPKAPVKLLLKQEAIDILETSESNTLKADMAIEALKFGKQASALISMGTSVLSGANTDGDLDQLQSSVLNVIAQHVITGEPLDLTNPTTVATLLQSAASQSGFSATQQQLINTLATDAAKVITATTQSINTAVNQATSGSGDGGTGTGGTGTGGGGQPLDELVKTLNSIDKVTNTVSDALESGVSGGSLGNVVDNFTGDALDDLVSNAGGSGTGGGTTPPPSSGGGGSAPSDSTAPTMSSAAVSADGRSIVITYSETVTGTLEAGDWDVTLSAGSTTVTGAAVGSGADANKITLALSNTIDTGLTVSNLVYTATHSTANSVKDAANNSAATQTLATITNGSTVVADSTAPAMSSAVVSADGRSIVVTYSEIVAGTLEAGDWGVTLSTGSTTVTSATIGSGADAHKITLALSNTIDTGLTVSNLVYTATNSTANSVKDQAATPNNAATQTLATVTNSSTVVADVTAPTMSSAVVSTDGRSIVITYSEIIAGTLEAGDWGVTLSAGSTTVTGATVGTGADAHKITLALSNTISSGLTVSNLVYTATAGTGNSVKDAAATPNNAATQTLATLTNSSTVVADVTAPTMSSATVAANGTSIVITYSEFLTGTPEAGDYAVTLGTGTTSVTGASLGTGANANKVTLTLGSAIGAGNTASIAYTAAAGTADSIKDAAATPNNAADQTLASGSVTNNSTVDLTAPTALVTTATIGAQTGNAMVQSTETGTAYLVKDTVVVTNLASITGAGDSNFNSVTITTANTNTNLAATGLVDGTYKVYSVDAAGNLSAASTNSVTVIATPPTAAAAAAGLAFSADTGSSSTDFKTKTAAQDLSGTYTGTIDTGAGQFLEISLDNGSTWTTATTAAGGNWTLTGQTLSASNTLKVRVTDAVGNSSTAVSQAYVYDTAAPTASVTTATIKNTANAVVQSTEVGTAYLVKDSITVTTEADITGATDNEWNSVSIAAANTNTNLAATGLVDGTYKVYAVDAAGNLSAVSTNSVTVDTTAPTAAAAAAGLAFSADTGNSSTDFKTKTAAQDLSGTYTGTLASGEFVEISLDNGSTWTTATTAAGGNWTLTGRTLTASNTLQVRVTDAAGNSKCGSYADVCV